jgi:hypothetical protein
MEVPSVQVQDEALGSSRWGEPGVSIAYLPGVIKFKSQIVRWPWLSHLKVLEILGGNFWILLFLGYNFGRCLTSRSSCSFVGFGNVKCSNLVGWGERHNI